MFILASSVFRNPAPALLTAPKSCSPVHLDEVFGTHSSYWCSPR
jgi:hypothetical protein